MWSELVFTGDRPRQTLSDQTRRGELRRVAPGIYTVDLQTPVDVIVRNQWYAIIGRLFPGAVITDRSALTGGIVDGVLYLAHDARERTAELPGLTVRARQGHAPLPDDVQLPGGLSQASKPRALIENAAPGRARSGRPPRTLTVDELADWIDRICRVDGEVRLGRMRQRADEIADLIGASTAQRSTIATAIGQALGTEPTRARGRALEARRRGEPYDQDRMARFDLLCSALRSAAPQTRGGVVTPGEFATQAFFESYFSNYIEGTTFTIQEARALVLEGVVPAGRTADGHDVVGTYEIVGDHEEMTRVAASTDEFVDLLVRRHAVLMRGRPAAGPGRFKELPNQAGNTVFVSPELTTGTLSEAFHRIATLDTAWERSVYVAFVVAEVHPFTDGNGRMARVMMNAELVAGGQSKIIVPTGARSDYLTSLRRFSRQDDPSVFVKTMRFLHDYTSQIDWNDLDTAEADLRSTNAFVEDDSSGQRLRLPRAGAG